MSAGAKITGRTPIPNAWSDTKSPEEYTMSFRGGTTLFIPEGAGEWRVEAYNADGDFLWSFLDPFLNALTFGQMRSHAREYASYWDEEVR